MVSLGLERKRRRRKEGHPLVQALGGLRTDAVNILMSEKGRKVCAKQGSPSDESIALLKVF